MTARLTGAGQTALDYHAATKHSPISIRTNRHFLDFPNQPMPFKVYEGLDPIELPRGLYPSTIPALDAIAGGAPETDRAPNLADLSKLFYYSAGITKSYDHGDHKLYFRAAACTRRALPRRHLSRLRRRRGAGGRRLPLRRPRLQPSGGCARATTVPS